MNNCPFMCPSIMKLPELKLLYSESLNNVRLRFSLALLRSVQATDVKSRTSSILWRENHYAFKGKRIYKREVPNSTKWINSQWMRELKQKTEHI